ncbi:potassium channel protein [Stieleria varia]|nr:potassium channel protein [Stieleria varia]
MKSRSRRMAQWIAGRAEVFMFWLSAVFLVCMAILVVLWVDVPGVQSIAAEARAQGLTAEPAELIAGEIFRNRLEIVVLSVMSVIWPIVVMEAIAHWVTRPWNRQTRRYHWFSFLFCVCPALRMCARSPEMGYRLWLPFLGWRRADKSLQRKLERMFSFPMLVIALMILPILVTEFFLKVQIAQYAWLRLLLHLGTGVIWFAFAAEFILMVSVAEKKIAYCKANWIDLAIILLPLLSFLRSLTMLRSTRLAKLMGLPQITRLARVYQLRGTLFRALRALILLEFAHRVFKTSTERRVARLKTELAESEKHARFLRLKIARLERENGVEDVVEEPAVDGE